MRNKFFSIAPIAYAMRHSFSHGYKLTHLYADLVAALVVSLIALPLSMALAIAVGLPPQHGIYTAIVAGITVPLLGGSITQVSGPTAAFVVIVAPIVGEHGLRGLIIATIMAGIILVIFGLAKLGRYISFVPYQVTTGFTSGIAVVIATLALNDLLGLHIANLHGSYLEKLSLIATHLSFIYWPEALIGIASLITMFSAHHILPKIPASILGILAGVGLAVLLQINGVHIATIGSCFMFQAADGAMVHGIPPFPPILHWPSFDPESMFAWPSYHELRALMVPALVIAVLAALESLLAATVADGIAGGKHQPNAELIAIGIGNILSGLAAGIPATGAIARTATNIHSGAKTPLASSFHALFILAYILLLAPLISYIPMASLAALLLTVAYRMSHYRQFIRTIQIAPRSDVVVLLACFGLTVFIDMVAGVMVGIVLACFLLIRRIAKLTKTEISYAGTSHIQNLKLPSGVLVYHISGLLFFGTVEKALDRTGYIQEQDIHTLIIDMEDVPLIDMTGLVAMKTLLLDFITRGKQVVLCGDESITDKILEKLPTSTRRHVSVYPNLHNAVKVAK